jgi:4-amino-4-deoxy-L-arabinose transferase-like glycosyltransferase
MALTVGDMLSAEGGLRRGGAWAPALGRAAVAALVFLGAALLFRAQGFRSSVLDPDEGLYMVQAASWLRGGWPFIAVWDMHPLGAPAMLAVAKALVPDPVLALRLAGVVAVAATAVGLRAIALTLGAGPVAGLAAGLLYVAHTTVLGGLATNTEILFAPWITLAAFLLLREARREAPPRPAFVFAAGLSVGAALLIKQVAALEASALWLAMVAGAWAAGRLSPARLLLLALVFAAGAGLPTGLVALGYLLAGEFEPWAHGNFWAPLFYGAVADGAPGPREGIALALPHLAFLGFAALGLLLGGREARRAAWPLLAWFAGALASVLAPWKFWDHYFLILFPPLCLLAALGLATAVERWALPVHRGRALGAVAAILVAMPLVGGLSPRIAHGLGLRAADPPRQVAELAADILDPGQALFIANWHPITYVLAGREPPTRFAFPGHLTGLHAGLTGIDADAELARVLDGTPAVIVVSRPRWTQMRPEARAAIEAALAARYEIAGRVEDEGGVVEVWRLR